MHLPPWPPLAEATAWLIEETGRRWTPDDVIRALLATSGHLELSLVIPRETALSIFNGLEYVEAGCLADPCPMGVHGAKQFLLDLQSSDVAVPLALNSAGGRYRTAVSFGRDDISLSRQSVYALRNEHESLRPNDPKASASSSLQGDDLLTAPTPEPPASTEPQPVQRQGEAEPTEQHEGRQRQQEKQILRALQDMGYDPRQLPRAPAGTAGPKAKARARLADMTSKVFDKAWQRLRDFDDIADAE